LGTTVSWYTMKFSDSHVGYVAGWEGDIMKTTMGGLQGIFNQSLAMEQGINLYPNPANEMVTIANPFSDQSKIHLMLNNVAGTPVYSSIRTGNQFQLSTANIPDGMYLLQISSGNKSTRQKLIIRH
jgi:hypothetical protein